MKNKAAKIMAAALGLSMVFSTSVYAADDGIKIGYNYFGTGGYSLAALANQSQIVLDACGVESVAADDQFSVETLVTDIENMISSGCDGIAIWLPAEETVRKSL